MKLELLENENEIEAKINLSPKDVHRHKQTKLFHFLGFGHGVVVLGRRLASVPGHEQPIAYGEAG